MKRKYQYFKGDKDKEFEIATMKGYVKEKLEIDKRFERLITPYIKNKKLKILDACCGLGQISYFLSTISPKSTFFGIDQCSYMIEEAKKLCRHKKNISFEAGDVYNLLPKYPKAFDISIIWKTLSWIPYYDELVRASINATKKHIFISALFYDGDIDFETRVREFQKEAGRNGFNAFHNVYSFPRFKKFVYGLGAKNIEAEDFKINIDIPRPPLNRRGTYTLKLESGERLQISGAVVLFWKIIRIDL